MFAVRQGAGKIGAGSLLHWRASRNPRLRLPASGIELGYAALTVAFTAILGVVIASFTSNLATTEIIAPVPAGEAAAHSTMNTAATEAGVSIGGAELRPQLIHNLGTRMALTSAVGRF